MAFTRAQLLQVGTASTTGAVQVGAGLSVDANGLLTLASGQPFPGTFINIPTTIPSSVPTTWQSPSNVIFATGCIELSKDNVTFTQDPISIDFGELLYIRWSSGPSCSGAPHGTTITGTITDGFSLQNAALTIDRIPNVFTLDDLSSQGLSTTITSNPSFLTGLNVPAYVTIAPGATLSNVQASIGATAFVGIPTTGTTLVINPNQSIQLRGDTGPTNNTTYSASIQVGDAVAGVTTDTWDVTTVTVSAAIAQPSITAPPNGSTGLNPASNTPAGINLTGSTYTPLNGAGAQTSSDWEVYKALPTNPETSGISSVSVSSINDDWVAATTITGNLVRSIGKTTVAGNEYFLTGTGNAGGIVRSSDGGYTYDIAATITSTAGTVLSVNIAGNGGTLIAVCAANGNPWSVSIHRSVNAGSSWTQVYSSSSWQPNSKPVYNVASGKWAAGLGSSSVFNNPCTITSTDDGLTWTLNSSFSSGNTTGGLATGGSLWITTRYNETSGLWVSTDGAAFTFKSGYPSTTVSAYGINDTGTVLVYIATTKDIYLSTDQGDNWTLVRPYVTSGPTGTNSVIPFVDGKFWAAGNNNTLWYSSDGITWDSVSTGGVPSNSLSVTTTNSSGALVAANPASVGGFGTELTLTDATSLSDMVVGDSVRQNTGGTPSSPTSWNVKTGKSNVTWIGGTGNTPTTYANNTVVTLNGSDATPGITAIVVDTSTLPAGWSLNLTPLAGQSMTVRTTASSTVSINTAATWNYEITTSQQQFTSATPGIQQYLLISQITGVTTQIIFASNFGQPYGTITAINSDSAPYTLTLSRSLETWTTTNTAIDISRTVSSPAPTTTPPDPTKYTAITGSPFTDTSAPFNTLLIPQSSLATSSTYYSRVQYATTNSQAATSPFSAWSSFGTASSFAIPPGTAYGGGYFGGQINVSGTIYNLIVAPVTGTGGQQGQYGGASPQEIQYKITSSADGGATLDEAYGGLATINFADSNHPMFEWCVNGANGPRSNGGIGGFTDWYIPAKNELAILYFFLKPTTEANNTAYGSNPNSVAPYTPNTNYGPGFPNRTASTLFQTGGAQAFSTIVGYKSSTEYSINPVSAWRQDISNGVQSSDAKDGRHYARAIRRVAA